MSEETAHFSQEVIEREACASSKAIPFGMKDGKLVSVAQVERGLACGCICPACESALEAVKGDGPNSYRHHFRHHRRSDCDAGLETGLHMLAKEVLAQSHFLVIPDVVARHGGRVRRIKAGRELHYRASVVEATTTESGTPNLRPDLIVEGELGGEPYKLFVEIFVRHKTGQEKIAKLKERGLAAIEIDLSQVPADETREFYEDAILRTAERRWLHNRFAEAEQLRMRAEAEHEHGHIAEKVAVAISDPELSRPNPWVERVTDAGLAELIGLTIDGHRCFATNAKIWQSAILDRHVLSKERVFQLKGTLRWLADQGLLKSAFLPLLTPDEGRLAHLKDCFPGFRTPHQVVAGYAGELELRGKLQKGPGKHGWSVPLHVARAAVNQGEEVVRWRLRLGALLHEFQGIKKRAIQGSRMDWEVWRHAPLPAHGGDTPEDLIKVSESRFQALLANLGELRAMLEPGGAIPAAGLLGLPLEPELEARATERREAAERPPRTEAVRLAEASIGIARGLEGRIPPEPASSRRVWRVPRRKQQWLGRGLRQFWQLLRRLT